MKILLSPLQIFPRFYRVKKEIIFHSKTYLMNHHILPILQEIDEQKIYADNLLTLSDAIQSDPFANGLIDHFLKPNGYLLNAKDIAIALNMGVHGHSNTSFLKAPVIDAAFYLAKKLKERFTLDDNLRYILDALGKNNYGFEPTSSRQEIETIFDDKKLLFNQYFNLYGSASYSETITVYYPGYDKSWIDWQEDESLQVLLYKYDVPRGFFLLGFDYQSDRSGWLYSAVRTKEKEYFNGSSETKGKVVWLR